MTFIMKPKKKEFNLSEKIVLVQSENGKWYSFFFKDCMEYHKSSYETLKGAIKNMENLGNEVVLIMDKNKNKLAGNLK